MPKKFKIALVDNGFQIIIYETKNDHGERIFYGLQNNKPVRLMRCCQEYEPEFEVAVKSPEVWKDFEIPTGDQNIEIAVREFLEEKIR